MTERGPVFIMVGVTYIDLQALCSFAGSLLFLFLALWASGFLTLALIEVTLRHLVVFFLKFIY